MKKALLVACTLCLVFGFVVLAEETNSGSDMTGKRMEKRADMTGKRYEKANMTISAEEIACITTALSKRES